MRKFLAHFPWRDAVLIAVLILFDLAMHPLTAGPDRLVHDPAVYRLWDANYMAGDWYTGMAVKSGIYLFYAMLVNAWHYLAVPEELWRMLWYVASLAVLYGSLVGIARLFTKSIVVVPVIAILHMLISTGANQPIWLYGPFLQIDGGLAPRSIGVALSLLSLLYLLRGSLLPSAAILGLATLVHVSNSFIVFTLFLIGWAIHFWLTNKKELGTKIRESIGQAARAIGVYLLFGGWFALYIAAKGRGYSPDFPAEQFVWSWIYFRAPYMALPTIGQYWWVRLFAHVAAIIFGWLLLRKRLPKVQRALELIALIGLGSVVYFFLFYFFAFIKPWLPGFQFYSLRVVYFAYFAAYLFIALSLLVVGREFIAAILKRMRLRDYFADAAAIAAIAIFLVGFGMALGTSFRRPTVQNLQASWYKVLDSSTAFRSLVPANQRLNPPSHTTLQYLLAHPEPFIGMPNMSYSPYYFPNIVTFKSFGFSAAGLPEWFARMNDVTHGTVQKFYDEQKTNGQFTPIEIDWVGTYTSLSADDVVRLGQKYNARLFLTYRNTNYPFEQIAEDSDFRLFKLP